MNTGLEYSLALRMRSATRWVEGQQGLLPDDGDGATDGFGRAMLVRTGVLPSIYTGAEGVAGTTVDQQPSGDNVAGVAVLIKDLNGGKLTANTTYSARLGGFLTGKALYFVVGPAGVHPESELHALITSYHGNINISGNRDLSSYSWVQIKADDVGNMVPVVDGQQGFGSGVSPALAFNADPTFSGQIVRLSPFPFPLKGRESPWLINPMSQPIANLTASFYGYAWIYPDTIGTLTNWPRRMPVAMHVSSYLRRFFYFPNVDFAAGYYGLNGSTPSPAGEMFRPQPSAVPGAYYGWELGSQNLAWFPPRSGEVGFSQPYRDQGVQWHLLFGNQKYTLWTSENGGDYTPRYTQTLRVLDAYGNSAAKQTNGNGSFTGLGPLGLRFEDPYNLLFVKDEYNRQVTCTTLGMKIINVKYLQPPDMYTPPPPPAPSTTLGAPLGAPLGG